MAPKLNRPAFVLGMILAVAAILVIVVDRDLAQSSLSPIYHPQFLLLY